METHQPLSTSEAAAVIRLVGDTAAVEGGLVAQKRYLMSGLAELIQADSWAWATTSRFEAEEVPSSAGFLADGFSPEEYARFHEALEHPDTAILNATFMQELTEKQTHLTRHRDQMDREGYFHRSAVYPIWQAAGVEHVILSARPSQRFLSHAGLYRRPGREPFSAQEVKVAHIVLSEVPWLHEVLTSELGSVVNQLSPRQRIVLNLLVEGQSRGDITQHLGLSAHTVGEYVKDIFRHFGVHSQPELIARFRRGDGGDEA